MQETVLPDWSGVADAIQTLDLAQSPAEFHGALCGWIAGGGDEGEDWLARMMADPGLPAAPRDGVFERLHKATRAQFEDRGFGFALLLPDAEASLAERSGALFDWCRGFLGGFGLAAGAKPPLSDEGREALDDIAKLAAAQPQDEGDEDDEAALGELEEFVRVATLLLHGDCVLGPRHRQQLN